MNLFCHEFTNCFLLRIHESLLATNARINRPSCIRGIYSAFVAFTESLFVHSWHLLSRHSCIRGIYVAFVAFTKILFCIPLKKTTPLHLYNPKNTLPDYILTDFRLSGYTIRENNGYLHNLKS